MFGVLESNNDNSEINKDRTAKIPQILDYAEQLATELDKLQDQVDEIPDEQVTPAPQTVIIEGTPGQPGKPGAVVTSPPKTVIVEKPVPGPTVVVTPRPEPKCNTKLNGTCILP
jgi:hypothetical protein